MKGARAKRGVKWLRNLFLEPPPRRRQLVYEGCDFAFPRARFRVRVGDRSYVDTLHIDGKGRVSVFTGKVDEETAAQAKARSRPVTRSASRQKASIRFFRRILKIFQTPYIPEIRPIISVTTTSATPE